MKAISILALCLALSACASKPTTHEEAAGAPENRVAQRELLKQRPGTVEVILIRQNANVMGIASTASIYMNDKPLVSLLTGQKVNIWVEPGLYVFKLALKERGQPLFTEWDMKYVYATAEIDAKETRRYEIRTDLTGLGQPLTASSSPLTK